MFASKEISQNLYIVLGTYAASFSLIIQSVNHVAAVQWIISCRYWARALGNVYIKHKNLTMVLDIWGRCLMLSDCFVFSFTRIWCFSILLAGQRSEQDCYTGLSWFKLSTVTRITTSNKCVEQISILELTTSSRKPSHWRLEKMYSSTAWFWLHESAGV